MKFKKNTTKILKMNLKSMRVISKSKRLMTNNKLMLNLKRQNKRY